MVLYNTSVMSAAWLFVFGGVFFNMFLIVELMYLQNYLP